MDFTRISERLDEMKKFLDSFCRSINRKTKNELEDILNQFKDFGIFNAYGSPQEWCIEMTKPIFGKNKRIERTGEPAVLILKARDLRDRISKLYLRVEDRLKSISKPEPEPKPEPRERLSPAEIRETERPKLKVGDITRHHKSYGYNAIKIVGETPKFWKVRVLKYESSIDSNQTAYLKVIDEFDPNFKEYRVSKQTLDSVLTEIYKEGDVYHTLYCR